VAVVEQLTLADFRRQHRGPVITPEDGPAFDGARTTFNGMLDKRPALVTRPLDVDDVVAAVSFATAADLPIAVRGGGHGVAGHCVGDGSLVVDLRLMRDVTVDPAARIATCGGGALWEDLDPPCQRHGLATTGGTFGDTGVAGLTLGGGIGHLMGLHGLTLDNLLEAKVVTADGNVARASEEENADLFWALRGGGGNFGVVVEFTFRLHPVGLLLGGLLVYPVEAARDVFPTFRQLAAEAPDELVLFGQVFRSAVSGNSGTVVSVAYFGDPNEGRAAIKPLTEGLTPIADLVRPMYYPELQEIFGRMPFGLRNYWSGRFLRELSDEVLELTAAAFDDPEMMGGGVLIECLHGAAKRVSPDATAFAGREASNNATFLAGWTDPADDERLISAARSYSAALAPWSLGEGYVNYASEMPVDLPQSPRMERLQRVKREYDPENRFRFNHNIEPAASS
jgi:FAD/FMN-containing dehydrogenase